MWRCYWCLLDVEARQAAKHPMIAKGQTKVCPPARKNGLAPNVTSMAVKKPLVCGAKILTCCVLSHCVLKMDAHFPGLASSFIQQINEAIQQKCMTYPAVCRPCRKDRHALMGPPFRWRRPAGNK